MTDALATAAGWRRPLYWPALRRPFASLVHWLSRRHGAVGYGASLLKVFWPYLVWNTAFDNSRIVAELGDRKSTRLNSSHSQISYAVFCLKKKKDGASCVCCA